MVRFLIIKYQILKYKKHNILLFLTFLSSIGLLEGTFDKSIAVGIYRITVELCRTEFLAFVCVIRQYWYGLDNHR